MHGADSKSDASVVVVDMEIRKRECLFPCCVVWCPIPLVTWLLPPVGHLGICYSSGLVTDFLGPRFVHRGSLGFGAVCRYWRLDPSKVAERRRWKGGDGEGDGEGDYGIAAWDDGVRRAERFFNEGEDYNIFGNNCHQYAAHALNLMAYDGKKDWNTVHLAAAIVFRGKWTDPVAVAKTWGPFAFVVALSIAFEWYAVAGALGGLFVLAVAWFACYNWIIASPGDKVYATPLYRGARELEEVSPVVD